MHQTENVNPADNALNKLFATIDLLSSKIDEMNERVDYLGSFVGLETGGEDRAKVEPPGQLSGLSLDVLNTLLSPKDANDVRAYFLRVLSLFRKYIKSMVLFGSSKTKTGLTSSSDIDIAFIIDDTDVQRYTLEELRSKLFSKMAEIARDFSSKIHAQTYPLAEFWKSIVKPDPVILTLLKDGVAVYDTGFFVPLQMLYRNGSISPTRDSIDNNVVSAETLLLWANDTLSTKLSDDLFRAAVAMGQALLMEYGYLPPVPKNVAKELMMVAVEKEHVLSKEDVDKLDDVIRWFKQIEHGELKRVTGEEYSKKYSQTKQVIDKILSVIEMLRDKKGMPKPAIDPEILKQTSASEQTKYTPKTNTP